MSDPRPALLARATADILWDVIVIGGGASGLGTALEAASRGYKTLLLEAHDYAKGTSSRSTKLVHGGVRYLAQGHIHLVHESLHERGLLKRNAPHLVHDLGFLIATYQFWRWPFYGIGLKLYDLLAGKFNLHPSRPLGRKATLAHIPTLKRANLKGGLLYFDGQFDDSRLAITLMRTLEDQGGVALNAAPVTGLLKTGGKMTGVRFTDSETSTTQEVRGRVVINATGIFVDAVRRLDEPDIAPLLTPSQGVHIVVDRRFLPGDTALMVPKTADGRVLFAVPWHDRTLIGTTDTPVPEISLEPRALESEINFILKTVGEYLDPAPQRSDILSVFAGLRPLVKGGAADTKSLSREHQLVVSDSGLITLIGGKWTTYRRMGEDTIDLAMSEAGLPPRKSVTAELHLHGWAENDGIYGSDGTAVEALSGANTKLHPDLPYNEAEVRWAVRFEQARTVEDILARRLRALLLDAAVSMAIAPRVAEIMATELGRDADWRTAQVSAFINLASGYLSSPNQRAI
ncbi:glycerol-3-phosphate dehydrogenase/oxidase [Asticcacaulis sp.]|uniref:glycerol-3-phosphate dehydrogenase/oxidase n=1 Tax=Asticcacaulis sp. TaxID=1872648 RepID=UPI002B9C7FA0|nr:glycerol-3-phosphate dehydrogenase/oxidase [Asticcacaulis sp.]HTM82631.1 glycerol-3-phosphate dehydrogenase/oxidase [Asticcacaulis sp.]